MKNNGDISTPSLKRSLGLPSLLFYGVGVIVGAGIYSVIGAVAGIAGVSFWLSFVIAGAAALLSALSYAELSAMLPIPGAEYVYVQRAFPNQQSLPIITSLFIVATGVATATTVALAFGGYFHYLMGGPVWLAAALLLGFCTVVNLIGIKESAWVVAACTIVEVGGLLILVTIGLPKISLAAAWGAPISLGILGGAATSFFIYTGFEGLANLVGESKDPTKNLPRALVISLSITLVLYVLVALSLLGLASPEQLASSASPLATALEKVSLRMADGIGWIALISTTNTALISLLVANRLLFGIASNKALPKALTRISSRQVPWVATLLVFGISLLLLPLGKVKVLASLSSFLILLVFIAINISVIVLRYREPRLSRPFQIPGTIKQFPILPALGVLSNLVLLTRFEKIIYLWGAIFIIFFVLLLRLIKGRSIIV